DERLQACWLLWGQHAFALGTIIALAESRPDLGKRWPSRLVATAAEKRRSVMPIRTPAKSNNWRPIALCLAIILFNPPMISAGANQTETPGPWIVAAKIMRNDQDSATGTYLKPGLVVTAAHLTVSWTANLSVHIAGTVLPANLVKQGEVEEV